MIGRLGPFLSGLLFALGLAVAGMTMPERVLAFLDVTGAWDPSLALVMVGGIGAYAAGRAVVGRTMRAPLFAPAFAACARSGVDARLVVGALLFGAGWGLAGYCPGPALVSSGTGAAQALWFTLAMVASLAATRMLDEQRRRRRRRSP